MLLFSIVFLLFLLIFVTLFKLIRLYSRTAYKEDIIFAKCKEMRMDFEKIYEDYNRDVYRFALRLCNNEDLAIDICHETFTKAVDKIGCFDGSRDIRAKKIFF